VLGKRLKEISQALLDLQNLSAREIMGSPDYMKLKSSMTLFAEIAEQDSVFERVLDKYFDGHKDWETVEILKDL